MPAEGRGRRRCAGGEQEAVAGRWSQRAGAAGRCADRHVHDSEDDVTEVWSEGERLLAEDGEMVRRSGHLFAAGHPHRADSARSSCSSVPTME